MSAPRRVPWRAAGWQVLHEGAWQDQGGFTVSRVGVADLEARGWSPESHHEFPLLFRRGVRHILGLMRALNAQRHTEGKAHIQRDVWYLIIAHLPCDWELDFGQNVPHHEVSYSMWVNLILQAISGAGCAPYADYSQ